MTTTTTREDVLRLLLALPADDLVSLASNIAGILSARFVTYPNGQASTRTTYPIYSREAAASAFQSAAASLTVKDQS